jgi:uncharacterized protein YidB (DUF937 family)
MLESMLGQLMGGNLQGPQANLLNGLMQVVQNQPGGLAGLLQRFESAGLGQVVQSWITTGPNQAISPAQVTQAMGDEHMQSLAQSAGISTQDVATHLSTLLPTLVDKLTPNGQLPAGMGGAGGGVGGALGGLLGNLGKLGG